MNKNTYLIPFILITSLFFLWGFAISMLDILNKHFQEALHISKGESGLIQFVVYGAYFLVALPAGYFINKYGYKKGIILGLLAYAFGGFLFYPAVISQDFHFFLLALFVIGCGLAILETVANPYVSVLGPPEEAIKRLNLSQSFNGLGVILGPLVGALILFKENGDKDVDLNAIQTPYIVIGIIVLLIAIVFSRIKLPEITPTTADQTQGNFPLYQQKHFTYGVIAQFFYVGAQAGVWGFFINFSTESNLGMSNRDAAFYLSGAMILFTAGRFISTFILKYIKSHQLLAVYAFIAMMLILVVILNLGMASIYALMLICFCMSIMFPTIFGLGIKELGNSTKKAGSFMIMSIVGGAIIPPLMGFIADKTSTIVAFYVPGFCFLIILLYALKGYRIRTIN